MSRVVLQRAAIADLGGGLVAAVTQANAQTSRQLVALAAVFERGISPAERIAAHNAIGEAAQRSVIRSFDASVTRGRNRRGNTTPYRVGSPEPNRRYAGGALRRALSAPDFFQATANGIRFGNVSRLNKEARHWARLNAGAGPRGRGSRGRFEVRWSNLVVATLGLDMDPRPAFWMPKGYWFDRAEGAVVSPSEGQRGSHEFYPMGTGPFRGRRRVDGRRAGGYSGPGLQRRRPSKGIMARRFLDAGVARIARDLAPTYEQLYENLWRQGVVGTATKANVRVVGPRPAPLAKSHYRVRR